MTKKEILICIAKFLDDLKHENNYYEVDHTKEINECLEWVKQEKKKLSI